MRNTATKKRAGQEDVDSDYLFANFLRRSAFHSTWSNPVHLETTSTGSKNV